MSSIQSALRAKLANNYGKVLDLFRSWDVDNDGMIRKVEMRQAVAALGFDAPQAAVDALFDSFDRDGGGSIEYKELHRVLRREAEAEQRLQTLQPSAAPPPPPSSGGGWWWNNSSSSNNTTTAVAPSAAAAAHPPPAMSDRQTEDEYRKALMAIEAEEAGAEDEAPPDEEDLAAAIYGDDDVEAGGKRG